ncbi:hypothetical protein DVS77_33730 [Mycolicibacterium moriokaense]|nr:hypothetical protein DVS77_33730 [Mycolicibacterium moriokaense]
MVVTMTTTATAGNVVFLEAHPAWRVNRRRSQEVLAAMRRHPSYQSKLTQPPALPDNVLVLPVHAQ